jgi:hypothetical protein
MRTERFISGGKRVFRYLSLLKEFREFIGGQLAIPEDFVKQPGADGLA